MAKKIYLILGMSLMGCATHPVPEVRELAAIDPRQFLYHFTLDREAGERFKPQDTEGSEWAEYEKLIQLFSDHFQKKYGDQQKRSQYQDQGDKGYALRAVHAKGHGCLIGEFKVENHGVAEYQRGVFKTPRTYRTIIRFSNGDGPPQNDADKKNSIGMAFKLLNVTDKKLLEDKQVEDSADFLLTNHPNFIVSDIAGFVNVIRGREGGLLSKVGAIKSAARGLLQRKKVEKNDPMVTPYWGNLPFKIGSSSVVKYLVRPEKCEKDSTIHEIKVSSKMKHDPDFLSNALSEHVQTFTSCFGFYLLSQANDKESPVEDAFVTWPENGYVTRVGTLIIPSQVPNKELPKMTELQSSNGDGKEICQNLSFTPWNTTHDFKPLSSLNRARRIIYELSSSMRRDLNHSKNPLGNQ